MSTVVLAIGRFIVRFSPTAVAALGSAANRFRLAADFTHVRADGPWS